MDKNIENKIEEAFTSIDQIERAQAPPFFFTRLEARMNKEKNSWENIFRFFTNPIWAFGSICVLLFLNIYIISATTSDQPVNVAQNTDLNTIDEYSQVSSTLFDFENIKP